jgi:hypothetical protein
MAFTGRFYGLTAAQLTTMQTEWLACLSAIATAGQSYTIAGRQFNRANLAEVSQTLGDINDALARAQGTRTTQTFANFSR